MYVSDRDEEGLTPEEKRFAEYYVVTLNAARAAAAVTSANGPQRVAAMGSAWLRKPHVKEAINRRLEAQRVKLELTQDSILKRYLEIADADARELSEYRCYACRFCYGKDHRYQMTGPERAEAYHEWQRHAETVYCAGREPLPFDERGGLGFDRRREPNPECPHCAGEGNGEVVLKDTSKLSRAAARLFAGARQTTTGVEIKTHDQMAALGRLASHVGIGDADKQSPVTVQFIIEEPGLKRVG